MKITALTYNFIGIPLFSQRYSQRLNVFIKELAKLQPEIICLQEIWLDSAKKKIINGLKGLDYSFYYPSLIIRFCGLLIGVKGKITKKGYVATNPIIAGFDRSILEYLGSKGYAFVEFELGKKKICIFNVHLSPDMGKKFPKKYLIFGAAGLIVALLVSAVLYYFFAPLTKVKIYVDSKPVSIEKTFTGSTEISDVDLEEELVPLIKEEVASQAPQSSQVSGVKKMLAKCKCGNRQHIIAGVVILALIIAAGVYFYKTKKTDVIFVV